MRYLSSISHYHIISNSLLLENEEVREPRSLVLGELWHLTFRLFLLLNFILTPSHAFSETWPPLRIATDPWPGAGIMYLAMDQNFFRELGVEVDLVWFDTYPETIDAFNKGDIDLLQVDLATAVHMAGEKKEFSAIFSTVDNRGFDTLISRPSVNSVTDLKGLKVGYIKGDISHFMTMWSLHQSGMDEGEIVHVEADFKQVKQKLQQGEIDAGVVNYFERPKEMDFNILFQAGSAAAGIDKLILHDVLIVKKPLLNDPIQRENLKKIILAWEKGIHYYELNYDQATKEMAKRLGETEDSFSSMFVIAPVLSVARESERLFGGGSEIKDTALKIAKFWEKHDEAPSGFTLSFQKEFPTYFNSELLVELGFVSSDKLILSDITNFISLKQFMLVALSIFIILVLWIIRSRFNQQLRNTHLKPDENFQQIKNVYIVGNPIKNKEMFFGREDIFNKVQTILTQDGPKVILLKGGRRSGKTSVLLQLYQHRIKDTGECVLCDFHSIANKLTNDESLPYNIGLAILENEQFQHLKPIYLKSKDTWNSKLEYLIQTCLERIAPRKLILLWDEFESIEPLFVNGTLTSNALLWARWTMDKNVEYIMTGSRMFEKDLSAVFESHSIEIPLDTLSPSDTLCLIKDPVDGILEYSEQAAGGIRQLSGGHPFYTQYICQQLINHVNTKLLRNYVEAEDLDDVIKLILTHPTGHIQETWRSLSLEAKLALTILANSNNNNTKDGYPKEDTIRWIIQKRRFPLSWNKFQDTMAGLVKHPSLLVERSLPQGNELRSFVRYRFSINIMRHWISFNFQVGADLTSEIGTEHTFPEQETIEYVLRKSRRLIDSKLVVAGMTVGYAALLGVGHHLYWNRIWLEPKGVVEAIQPPKTTQRGTDSKSADTLPPKLISPMNKKLLIGPTFKYHWNLTVQEPKNIFYEIEREDENRNIHSTISLGDSYLEKDLIGKIKWRVRTVVNKKPGERIYGEWSESSNVEFYNNTLQKIVTKKQLSVGVSVSGDDSVFVHADAEGLAGAEIDLLRSIFLDYFSKNGITQSLHIIFTEESWGDKYFSLLSDNSIDLLVSGISITADRAKKYNLQFSDPNYIYYQSVLTRNNELPIKNNKFTSSIVAVKKDTTSEQLACRILGDDCNTRLKKYQGSNSYYDMVNDLISKKIDAIVLDKPFALTIQKLFFEKGYTINKSEITTELFTGVQPERIGFAVRKHDNNLLEILNTGIADNKKNSREIIQRYMPGW